MLSMIMCTARYMVYAHHVVFLCVCITLCWFKGSVHMLLVCLGSSVGGALAGFEYIYVGRPSRWILPVPAFDR